MGDPSHRVKIVETRKLASGVRCFVLEKPEGYAFEAGQATDVAIAKDGWRDQERPFTFTSLDRDPCLELTVKVYPEREGVTDRLDDLRAGDELLIGDPWGAIEYRGPGVFLAGGAGITPFLAILRRLHAEDALGECQLFFANDTSDDVILACELKRMLGARAYFTVTHEPDAPYPDRRFDADFLRDHVDDFDRYFYVCGPPDMVEELAGTLSELGVADDHVVTEETD